MICMDILVNELIKDSAFILNLKEADRSRLIAALENVRRNGVLRKQETRDFAICGLPILSIISNILKVNSETAAAYISKGQISYSDLCGMIGIFAQDLKLKSQGI